MKIVGWGALGLGLVSGGLGGFFAYKYSDARSDVDALANEAKIAGDNARAAPDNSAEKEQLTKIYNDLLIEYNAEVDEFENNKSTKYTTGAVLGFGIGAALMATGVVLLIVDHKQGKESSNVALTPGGFTVRF